MLANQASSTPPITTDSSDQMMQDGAGRLWTSLGQSPGLKLAWRRLPVFRSDMERRSAVISLIVAVPHALLSYSLPQLVKVILPFSYIMPAVRLRSLSND